MGAGYVNAFLSILHEKDYVTSFKDRLERRGFSAFVAHEDITPSAAWREWIEAHLSTCDLAIAFIHPGFPDSQWTEQEIGWVLGVGRPIMSLLFDPDTELRGFMAFRQAIKVGQRSVSELADMVTDSAAQSATLGPSCDVARCSGWSRARTTSTPTTPLGTLRLIGRR